MCNHFGDFIRVKRKAKRITIRALARSIGISAVYLSSIETGKRSAPSYEVLDKIADELNLSFDEKAKMYDLAVETKNVLTTPYDLDEYLNRNPYIKNAVRLSMKYNLSNKDWDNIINYIKDRFMY